MRDDDVGVLRMGQPVPARPRAVSMLFVNVSAMRNRKIQEFHLDDPQSGGGAPVPR